MPRTKGALKARDRDTTKRAKAGLSETMRREYAPRLCQVVINQGRQGKSRAQIAVYLGVTRNTLLRWEAAHPEFKEAMEIALDHSLAWWETKAQKSLNAKHFQTGLLNKMIASRYPQDYGDKSQLEITNEPPLTVIQRVIVDPYKDGTWKGNKEMEALRRRDRAIDKRRGAIDVDPAS
jgi:hypothetical protein